MQQIHLHSAAQQTANYLRSEVMRGALINTMPGVPTLMAELGVSQKTVKAALRILEKEGLLVNEGQGLRRRIELPDDHVPVGMRVALLRFEPQDQGKDFIIDLRYRLEAAGHVPFYTPKCLTDMGRKIERIAPYARKTKADAWIVFGGSHEVLEWFAQREAPAFALFGARERAPMAATGPDKAQAQAVMTRRLIALGHRRISFIVRHEHRRPRPSRGVCAYLDELQAGGIPASEYNLPDWQESREGFTRLLDSLFGGPTPPTALILDEAFEFHASYHHLSQRGLKIPQDVSLICTDEDPGFAWCEPTVSHIRWDSRPVVRRIVRWANNVARGRNDRRQTLTQTKFIEGGTIGPAPKSDCIIQTPSEVG